MRLRTRFVGNVGAASALGLALLASAACSSEAPVGAGVRSGSEAISTATLSTQPAGLGARAFQPVDLTHALVLGADGNLWYEHAPFGSPPPGRIQVDGNVRTFEADGDPTQGIYVLGTDRNLWKEFPDGTVPPRRTQIDGNVQSFQAQTGTEYVAVLGTDGNLWFELPDGTGAVPPPRGLVDSKIDAFQVIDMNHVLVRTPGRNLFMVDPFATGLGPVKRAPIDGNVVAFQGLSPTAIGVLGWDGNLWREYPNGNVPPPRDLIDQNVRAFQWVDDTNVYVLDAAGDLWIEAPNGSVPPPRLHLAGSVGSFAAQSNTALLVLDRNNNVWSYTRTTPVAGTRGVPVWSQQLLDGNVDYCEAARSGFDVANVYPRYNDLTFQVTTGPWPWDWKVVSGNLNASGGIPSDSTQSFVDVATAFKGPPYTVSPNTAYTVAFYPGGLSSRCEPVSLPVTTPGDTLPQCVIDHNCQPANGDDDSGGCSVGMNGCCAGGRCDSGGDVDQGNPPDDKKQ